MDLTAVESESGQPKYQLKYDGFNQVGEYQLIFQASNLDGFATLMQSRATVTEATTKPATNLTVGVNGDGAVNIFDLAIAAGNFGQSAVTAASAIATRMELGHLTAGSYSQTEKAIYWDRKAETGEQVGSGTYFYQLWVGDYTETRKIVILK